MNEVVAYSDPTSVGIDLPVSCTAQYIEVAAGVVKILGDAHQLAEAERYDFVQRGSVVDVCGWLALDRNTNEPRVLVTEHIAGVPPVEIDRQLYQLWNMVFTAHIPANATGLDSANVTRYSIVPPSSQEM